MGSGNSRMSERRPKPTKFKRRLSTFICGSSSSRATAQTEDYPVESLVNSAGYSHSVSADCQALPTESVLNSSGGIKFNSPKSERGCLPENINLSSESLLSENAEHNIESTSKGKCCTEGNESVPAHHLSKESRSSQSKHGGTTSRLFSGEQSLRDVEADMVSPNGVDGLVNNDSPELSSGVLSPLRNLHLSRVGIEGPSDAETGFSDSSSVAPSAAFSSNIVSRPLEDDSIQEVPSGLGARLSDRIQGSTEGNALYVDVMSISSRNLSEGRNETSAREARRNSRRMFWDAFTSRSSRRHADFSTILFATDDTDNIGSGRSWLLDFSNDIFDDGMSNDLWSLGRRSHLPGERRGHSRSEFWERLRGGNSGRRRSSICPSGLHSDGSCLCGLEDEPSSQTSMSRIVMLAEALFEVLDELHRQPTSFALSMLSNPAPESTVDSLPIKSYEKSSATESGDDVDQCYICLEEYEPGDKIRVLPCTHEYHTTCVDKWLKEIHGVCPLCRGDVRQGSTEEPLADSGAPSVPVDLT